jgi:hypothetical protein
LNAAKKIILCLWLVIVASLGNVSAFTPGTAETCVWQKSFETLATRQAEPLQTLGGHQENGNAGYDYASASLLAAETGGNVGKTADKVLEWLGPDSKISKPPGGSDLVLRSADGTKQIRFDLTNPHGLDPHVNVETFEPRNLFPGDRKMIQTGNDHVFLKP